MSRFNNLWLYPGAADSNRIVQLVIYLAIMGFYIALMPMQASADPLAPSLLEIIEIKSNVYVVHWRTPAKLPVSNPGILEPVFPSICAGAGESYPIKPQNANLLSVEWRLQCDQTIEGKQVSIKNLVSTSANTLLRIELADGRLYTQFLTPDKPDFKVPAKQTRAQVFKQYLLFGAQHLAVGIDHILFLIGLVLLAGFNRSLVITVTLFTVAHSISLCLSVLQLVSFPASFAEILIALSISYTMATYLKRGNTERDKMRLWIIAFCFGLLHGLGFANVLQELGLPNNEVVAALVAFNLGIEFGQLAVIALLALTALLIAPWFIDSRSNLSRGAGLITTLPIDRALAFSAGTLSALWFWQRLAEH